MVVLVCGSRIDKTEEPKRYATAEWAIDIALSSIPVTFIVSGGAKGPDTIAENWAKRNDVPVSVFLPDWKGLGRRAGIVRNDQMLDTKPDLVLAFWDGQSKGTKHTIDQARKRGITVEIYYESEGKSDPTD